MLGGVIREKSDAGSVVTIGGPLPRADGFHVRTACAGWRGGILPHTLTSCPLTDVRFHFLSKVMLARNTAEHPGWAQFEGHSPFHSWLCVPLLASQEVLGLLCLGDSEADVFTQEHLHIAKSLAIPGAVAIQNARLYERAEIYGAELEKRLIDLEQMQQALDQAERSRATSEDLLT